MSEEKKKETHTDKFHKIEIISGRDSSGNEKSSRQLEEEVNAFFDMAYEEGKEIINMSTAQKTWGHIRQDSITERIYYDVIIHYTELREVDEDGPITLSDGLPRDMNPNLGQYGG